jgi:hypothetical protein
MRSSFCTFRAKAAADDAEPVRLVIHLQRGAAFAAQHHKRLFLTNVHG